jgi:chemotaxis response regulator CheB
MRKDRAVPLRQGARAVRIVIADDDSLFARRVRARAAAEGEFEVVGIAADGQQAGELAGDLEADVIMVGASRGGLADDALRRSADLVALLDVVLAVTQVTVPLS